ncbi:MAG: hypothetical protein WCD79_19600 [Chthoniobacteraceae bacterium]
MNSRRPPYRSKKEHVKAIGRRHANIIKRESSLVCCALAMCLASAYFLSESIMHSPHGWRSLFLGTVGAASCVAMLIIRSSAAKDRRERLQTRQDVYDLYHDVNVVDPPALEKRDWGLSQQTLSFTSAIVGAAQGSGMFTGHTVTGNAEHLLYSVITSLTIQDGSRNAKQVVGFGPAIPKAGEVMSMGN